MSTPHPDRLPPHSPEDERGVLGCILEAPAEVLAVLAEQRAHESWFFDLRHRTIFNACLKLYTAKTEEGINLLSLTRTLKEMNLLDDIGGLPYLNEIQDSVAGWGNLPAFLGAIRQRYRARNLISWATNVVATIYEANGSANMDELCARIESEFDTLSAPDIIRTERHIKDVIMNSVLPLIERHYNRGKTQLDGLPTGDNWYLDKVLLGIAPNDYVILAGRPGEGKTSLALNIVNYLAKDYVWWREITRAEFDALPPEQRSCPPVPQEDGTEKEGDQHFARMVGIPIGVFTLEMTEDSLGFRLVFGRAKVSSQDFRNGFATKGMWNQVNKSVAELCQANIYLDGEADQTIDMIAAKARRWARQYGIKLFVLDYLQLLDSDDGDNDRVRALRKISKKIVSLKKRLNIPWLVLAQMNRNIETTERARRPVMSDLKESGSLEQDADKIVILYHPLKTENIEPDEDAIEIALVAQADGIPFSEAQRQAGTTDFLQTLKTIPTSDRPRRINALVVKNRNGPTGPAALLFQNNQCLFQDWRRYQVEHQIVVAAKGEAKPKISPEDLP